MTEFRKYPSIPRYRKDIQVTEKIDGSNAAIVIGDDGATVRAQSRNRFVTPDDDNHGFARWVYENREELVEVLPDGYHYGEWWGSGINRGYGLKGGEKHFTLFNPARYEELVLPPELLTTVPVLYEGPAQTRDDEGNSIDMTDVVMEHLKRNGSFLFHAQCFPDPEGVVIFHTASRQLYKVTYNFDEGKWTQY